MNPLPTDERRAHRRECATHAVDFEHGPTRRRYPARCADISDGGVKMFLPAAVPVREGQAVRLAVRSDFSADNTQPSRYGRIVRVERSSLFRTGQLAVGVQFVED